MIKGSIQEEITLINIYMPNIGIHTHTEIQEEMDSNTIIVGHFTIPMTSLGRSSRQKINKETLALNEPLDSCRYVLIAILLLFSGCFSVLSSCFSLFLCSLMICFKQYACVHLFLVLVSFQFSIRLQFISFHFSFCIPIVGV